VANNSQNWAELGYYQVTIDGGNPFPARPTLDLIPAGGVVLTADDDPTGGPNGAGVTHLTINVSGGGSSTFNYRAISTASSQPVTANAQDWLDVDLTGGPVTIQPASSLLAGQSFRVSVAVNGSDPSAHALTINAPLTGMVSQLPPNNGSLSSTLVINTAAQKDGAFVFLYDGTNLRLG
jgi:hypothetical protein